MGKRWTIEEIELLKKMYKMNVSDEEIAEQLGRTKASIANKRIKINLIDDKKSTEKGSKRRFSEKSLKSLKESRKKYKRENHPSWKGGKRINAAGYVEIHKPEHHRARGNGYVFEHILVVEEMLQKPITIDEEIHHIDGNKQNNSPFNLQIVKKNEHARLHGRRRKGSNLICPICRKQFYRKPSHVKKSKTCSRKCQTELFKRYGYKGKKINEKISDAKKWRVINDQ